MPTSKQKHQLHIFPNFPSKSPMKLKKELSARRGSRSDCLPSNDSVVEIVLCHKELHKPTFAFKNWVLS